MFDSFSSSGLAGSAADRITLSTGIAHESVFRPRGRYVGSFDPQAYVVEPITDPKRAASLLARSRLWPIAA